MPFEIPIFLIEPKPTKLNSKEGNFSLMTNRNLIQKNSSQPMSPTYKCQITASNLAGYVNYRKDVHCNRLLI